MDGFVKISKYAGMREDLVQAGGGNSSFKISDSEMVIKVSGWQLADITAKEGYATVNPGIIRDGFMNCNDLDSLTETDSNEILEKAFITGGRASIETFLHSISGRYTLHSHPMVVNALTCRDSGDVELRNLFPEALIVPYAKPGVQLAKAYFKEFKKFPNDGEIAFLMNHGLIVSAETADEVIEKTEEIVKRIEDYLQIDGNANRNVTEIWKFFPDKIIWRVTDINVLNFYRQNGKWDYQFCPDCVVFLGKQFIEREQIGHLEEFIEKNGNPNLVLDGKNIYIVADTVKKALEMQSILSFSAQVMQANEDSKYTLLSEEQQNEILNWDAEKYRRQLR